MNTVVVRAASGDPGARRLIGDNTDWLGILRPVSAALASRPPCPAANGNGGEPERRVGVVVGSGGTARAAAYALGFGLGLDVVRRAAFASWLPQVAWRLAAAAAPATCAFPPFANARR